jgi:hypothetical protein
MIFAVSGLSSTSLVTLFMRLGMSWKFSHENGNASASSSGTNSSSSYNYNTDRENYRAGVPKLTDNFAGVTPPLRELHVVSNSAGFRGVTVLTNILRVCICAVCTEFGVLLITNC